MTKFVKRGLVHASDFSTLSICNSASIGPAALKFGSKLFYHCTNRTENISLIVLTNEVMAHHSWKIRCVYKTPFRKFGHI